MECVEFKGSCIVIRFIQRDENDKHVCIQNLIEDDGELLVSKFCCSSAWIDDADRVWQCAKKWIKNNCEPDIIDGIQYGYKFK